MCIYIYTHSIHTVASCFSIHLYNSHIAPNLTGFPAFYILFICNLLTTVY